MRSKKKPSPPVNGDMWIDEETGHWFGHIKGKTIDLFTGKPPKPRTAKRPAHYKPRKKK